MKNLIFALAMAVGAAATSGAYAALPTATPLWACNMRAQATHDNRFYVILKAGEVDATGTIYCRSLTGQTTALPVNVKMEQLGIGLGIGFPAENAKIDILSLKGGVASPKGMYGQYQVQAGPGVTLFGERIAAEGGLEYTPGLNDVGGRVQITVEQMFGLGVDITGSTMTITPR